ncbi:MAG: glutaminase [Bacteroidales bacterium]|nr:glutaminase [Bacteroidales bacterium]
MDYGKIIDAIYRDLNTWERTGKVADYIPALAQVDPQHFGISVQLLTGESFHIGDTLKPFSIQSISKVFTLAMVFHHLGEDLWKSVGREPSGTPFNSLIQLEQEAGIPRNPMINAGALVVTDRLLDDWKNPKEELLSFVRCVSGNPSLSYDFGVANSELANSDRNRALAHFMKSYGNIHNDVNDLMDVYCHQCSLQMNTRDLAKSFQFLVNRGVNPWTGNELLTLSQAKRLGAVLMTCGFYDESGDFAFRVGMPGKSGVGGGVVAYIPNVLSIAVWSPALNPHGNSTLGIEALERFTTLIGNSVF